MPQLRSGKVVGAGKAAVAEVFLASLSSPGAGVGCEPGEQLVVEQSPHLAPEGEPEQPLPPCVHPAGLSRASAEQRAPPRLKERAQGGQRLRGKKGEQSRMAARSRKGAAVQASDSAGCAGGQAAVTVAGVCWEQAGSREVGEGQQPLCSGIALQKKFPREISSPEGPSLSGLQESLKRSRKKRKHSNMELTLQIPTSEEELKSTGGRGGVSRLPEAEVLQPRKGACSTEMKGTGSLMILKLQMPGLKKSLGTEESFLSEPKLQEVVDNSGVMNGCLLQGLKKPKKEGTRCVRKKDGPSLVKSKLQGPRKRGKSALVELPMQCAESKERAVSLVERDSLPLPHLQGLSGQQQPTTGGELDTCCMIDRQQSSEPQRGADSMGESATKNRKKKQDSGMQAAKKFKANLTTTEDGDEKESHFSESPAVAALGGTRSKSFLCHPETKRSGAQLKKRKPRMGPIKRLQSSSVTTAEKVINTFAKCDDAERSRNTLSNSNNLLCVTRRNPVVKLEACSCINTFVKSSMNGATSTFKLSGLFHVAQGKRKSVCPGGTVEQNDVSCSANRTQSERSPIKDSVLFNKEVKPQRKEGHSSCHQSKNSKLSEKKCITGRKQRKKMKSTEASAVQTLSTDVVNECSKYELPAEAAVASSGSSAVFGQNNKAVTLSDCYDCTSDLHTGSNSREAQNASVRRKTSTKSPAFEDGFKKTTGLSVVGRGKGSRIAAPQRCPATSGSQRAKTPARDVSNCHNNMTDEKLNKVKKKLQRFTCRRAVPVAGKRVWPIESCARTSERVPKNHGSVSEGKIILSPVFEESSDKNSVKATGNNAVTGNLRQLDLDLHASLAEVNKESAHKIVDPDAECLTSVETSESSSVATGETCGKSNANAESPANMVRSAVPSNPDNRQEVKAASNFTTKRKDKNKGAVTKRNLSEAVRDSTSTGNRSRVNLDRNASVVKQTLSDLKLTKAPNTRNLTNFKIPLRRNKPESRALESVGSFESKTCSTPELLDSTGVSERQKTDGDASSVKAKEQPLPIVSDATSAASMKKKNSETNSKDVGHDGSEGFSDEMSRLPERVSLYPCPTLESQLKSSLPDLGGTERVRKPGFPHRSEDAADHPVALGTRDDSKSRVNLPQHKGEKLPDTLEAYNEDVLVIDVIQDDPDLFGTSGEEELAVTDRENCPAASSCPSIVIKEERQNVNPEFAVISENKDSVNGASEEQSSEGRSVVAASNSLRSSSAVSCRDSNIQESGVSNYAARSWDSLLKATDIKTRNSSSGNSPLRSFTEYSFEDKQLRELDELLKSFEIDGKLRLTDRVAAVEPKAKVEAEKSDCKYKDPVKCELLSGLPLQAPKENVFSESMVLKPWRNECRFSGKSLSVPLQNYGDSEPWKMIDKNIKGSYSVQQILEMIDLPHKYCRLYFMTLRGCERARCWFWHVPKQEHEKVCMAILKTYISINESGLLKRAVQIFVRYYREVTPREDFAVQVLNDLLICLLKKCLLQEVFQILNVTAQINTLPALEVLLRVFEHVASLNIRDAVPALISTFCKLIDAGMFLEFEHFNYIIKLLQQLQVSSQEINTVLNIKSRFQEIHFKSNWLFDFNLVMAEIQHCKEKNDWTKMGDLYVNARTACEHSDDLQKLSLCIAEILTRVSEKNRPGVPFCDFADAVIKKSRCNEADRTFIGRAGISVMNSYCKVLQWIKGRKVLDKLQELQIHFTVLKGLTEAERLASRCQIVNNAAEIFLKTGSLDGATWVLRESEWITNAPLWPCDERDILNRHNLLCSLVHRYLKQSLYRQAFEVLQNLPGFQNSSDTIDVSQYSCIFNELLNACFESKNLGVSSSAVDFMLSKNIAVDFFLLRGLITGLGRSCLWSKARTYYKAALSLGCYPPLQGNLHHKILQIPFYVSEVEMLLAIELFLVSNASDIQSPGATTYTLQIILKRCEDQTVQNNSDYQAGMERLTLAARISDPKLFLKHMTVNVNMEEVYSLELTSALKWLRENMKWAGKVWLFQQS